MAILRFNIEFSIAHSILSCRDLWSGLMRFVGTTLTKFCPDDWRIGYFPLSFCYPTMTELAEQIEYIADHFQYVPADP